MVSRLRIVETVPSNSLARAFALSLIFHFILFSVVEVGGMAGLWKVSFLRKPTFSTTPSGVPPRKDGKKEEISQKKDPEVPLVFVDVDPANAAPEPPKESKYYSSANSAAGNPNPKVDTKVVKVEGTQDKMPKTTPNLRTVETPPPPLPVAAEPKPEPIQPKVEPAPPPVVPLQPSQQTIAAAPPAPKPEPEPPPVIEQPRAKPLPAGETVERKDIPRTTVRPGTIGAIPESIPAQPAPPSTARTRPRTLAEAKAQKGFVGEKMNQEGGVRRETLEASLDVRATPFGAYDAAFIAAVRARWFNLLDERNTPHINPGKVVVEFRLTQEGRITHMHVLQNEVTETLSWICQRAVMDPAPFQRFPSDLRRLLGVDYRDVRFTFHYN